MRPRELLPYLESLGITLTAESGNLRISAPRGSLNAELKAAVAAAKKELLETLTLRSASRAGGLVALAPTEPRRTSDFQQRLWILQQMDRATCAYNLARVWWTLGLHDSDSAVAAVRRLVSRHAILHSTFHEESAAVVALPGSIDAVSIEVRDASNEVGDEQRARIRDDLQHEVRRAFDLTAALPVRFIVYRLGPRNVALMVIAHHIAVDDWSLSIIGRELLADYDGAAGVASPELQFHDFAAWQHRAADRQRLGADVEWWAVQLANAPPLSCLAPDRDGAGGPSSAVVTLEWDRQFAQQLRAVVHQEQATVFMSMIAACAVVLRWHTGQTDVVFGIPVGTRERTELESMIGPFVNLLLLRLDVAGDPSFAELLRRARDALLEAHEHRRVPFELLLERLRPARSLERSPLFQIALVQHQSAEGGAESLQASGGSMHELTWYLNEGPSAIQCAFEYRADLYSQKLVERMARHLEVVLRRGSQDSATRLSKLGAPTDAEHRWLVEGVNATAVNLETGLLQRFEGWAREEPQRIAVSFAGRAVSYGELNRAANRLAHRLRLLGAGPGMLIALLLPRTASLVTALLAVLKSGAAYVPLDPQFPADRIGFMLQDSGAAILLVSGQQFPGVRLPPSLGLLDVDQVASMDDQPEADPSINWNLNDPAYVIYTSGSTGQPKGVTVARRSLDNLLSSMSRLPGLSAGDTLAAVTTISFDIAALELYLPLYVGARIELVGTEIAADGHRLARLLSVAGATVLQATPATWRLLVDSGWSGSPVLRALCGGEALTEELAGLLLDRVAELWNLYGPTETTVWSTVERIVRGRPISIGRPIDNTQVYVVGSRGELMPMGTPGEIWIGGHGVAIGYHNRPDLSSERFVDDPFASSTPGKLYRTGDLGRWREDGYLEHLGRIDDQIKIRGYRVELAEVEAVLRALPEIEQAIAAAVDASHSDRRLVAYVVFRPGEELTASEVRRRLRVRLPEFMIPSLVVAVDAIPLTPNGKIDRRALPNPFGGAAVNREFVPPAEGLEKMLADVWANVLKVDRIGANDNFFDLGGHSLLSLRVAADVQKRSGWSMDPRTLFFASLRQIAAMAERATIEAAQNA